jgi:hypothetical protein
MSAVSDCLFNILLPSISGGRGDRYPQYIRNIKVKDDSLRSRVIYVTANSRFSISGGGGLNLNLSHKCKWEGVIVCRYNNDNYHSYFLVEDKQITINVLHISMWGGGEEHRLRVSENRVLRRTFRAGGEVAWGWIRLHKEELRKLYASLHIIRLMKSRRMRCSGHVARTG